MIGGARNPPSPALSRRERGENAFRRSGGFREFEQLVGAGAAHATEAAEVGGEAGVGISGALAFAIGYACGVGASVPVSAAHDALYIRSGACRPGGVG